MKFTVVVFFILASFSVANAAVITVRPGDNLSCIAEQEGVTVQHLLAWNPQIRQDPDLIFPGTELRFLAGGATYVVRPGDNLTRIAGKLGCSSDMLLALNPEVVNPDLIFPGMRLAYVKRFGNVFNLFPRTVTRTIR